jgi:hypothetical protein
MPHPEGSLTAQPIAPAPINRGAIDRAVIDGTATERAPTDRAPIDPGSRGLEPIVLTEYGIALADAVQAAMPAFVAHVVEERKAMFAVPSPVATLSADVAKLGQTVTAAVDVALREFLASDLDSQRTTPLTIIRSQMAPLNEFLRSIRCAHAVRDPFDESAFPNDVFAVGPHAWKDFGEAVHEAGLRWGAAKAMAHRQRHRSE